MGRIIVAGGSRAAVPVSGVPAGSLAVGTIVKLRENGTLVDYLVVNQGKPGNSSLYDASCDGTWLLRNDICEVTQWSSANVNDYTTSNAHSNLNGAFYKGFGEAEKAVIKQVKVPYCIGAGNSNVCTGGEGLRAYVFLLSPIEAGCDASGWVGMPTDGAKLAYFEFGVSVAAMNIRRAKYNGNFLSYWTRTPVTQYNDRNAVYLIDNNGDFYSDASITGLGIRPALVISPDTAISPASMELVGVA